MAFTVFTEHYNMDDPPSNRLLYLTRDVGLAKVLDSIPDGFNSAKATMVLLRQHLEHFYTFMENRPQFPEPYTTPLANEAYVAMANLFRRLAVTLKTSNIAIKKTKYVAKAVQKPVTPSKTKAPKGGPPTAGPSNPNTGTDSRATLTDKSEILSTPTASSAISFLTISDDESVNPDVDLDAWDLMTNFGSEWSVNMGDSEFDSAYEYLLDSTEGGDGPDIFSPEA